MSQMTEEELKEKINKIRAARTSAQTLKAEIALGKQEKTKSPRKKVTGVEEYEAEPEVNIDEYT